MSTPAQYINPALSGYGIYQGATSGNPLAQARAAANATKLGNNLYNQYNSTTAAPGSTSSDIGTGATGALDALNIYQGINQGGWQGDTKAGASGLQLAGLLADNPALSAAGGYIAAPLALYNYEQNYKSGATGSDALNGAETGATIGTSFGPLGTLVGGVIGGAAGALSSAFGPGAKDPETAGVQNVINATSANQNNPGVAASVQDPYTALAGLMDERSSTLPMYQQYGRMGEQKFTDDMVNQINQAVKANPSLANNPQQVYSQVVSPWVNSMGSGYSKVGDTYTATTQGLLEDMTNQYLSGQASQDWKAVGGDSPFENIYQGSPINAAPGTPVTPTASNLPPSTAGTGRMVSSKLAKGGSTHDKLRKLYEGSFVARKRNYDDGGGVDFGDTSGVSYPWTSPGVNTNNLFDTGSNYSTFNNQDIFPSTETSNAPTDTSNLITGGLGDVSTNSSSNTSSGGSGNSVLGSGGALSGLGSALGVSSVGQLIQQYGALAPLLAAALGGNKQASAPATPAGYGAIPSIATPSYSRPYTQPNVANWYTYGEGPEQSFFGNNQLPNIPGVSPAQSAQPSASSGAPQAAPPTAPATNPNMSAQPIMGGPQPIMRAHGGSAFDSTQGDSYVQDPGHGDGTSDGIDAKLSGGEYVMDAGTVSMLGNGSNEAGSRALDQLRQRIRKHAGKQLVKGKQFMKAKPAESYMSSGAKEPS